MIIFHNNLSHSQIREYIPSNAMIIGEGANTMDIGRTMLPNVLPRHRLDAGTFATMGVGAGFAFAAKALQPSRPVCLMNQKNVFMVHR